MFGLASEELLKAVLLNDKCEFAVMGRSMFNEKRCHGSGHTCITSWFGISDRGESEGIPNRLGVKHYLVQHLYDVIYYSSTIATVLETSVVAASLAHC